MPRMPNFSLSLTTLVDQLKSNPINWALLAVLVYALRNCFTRPAALPKPRHPSVIVFRHYTPRELAHFNGREDPSAPILLAVKGNVFDVTRGRNFYGPDGPYGNFAGRDASRGLAKESFSTEMLTPLDQPIDTLEDLTAEEREALDEWEAHFQGKYNIVGKLVNEGEKKED
ncbi:uncharacterized protein VTP21DRAFT_7528 [Calcarisporiella thermophila]|uniref:uncharacterized protein n=1 Tax=Calcarisporiella thermophila TaxID=911321 RepID=UPI003742B3FE